MRLAVLVLVTALIAIGGWLHGAANGYEHGKIDAFRSLRTYGIVVMKPDGSCRLYDKPGEEVKLSNVASYTNTVFLVILR